MSHATLPAFLDLPVIGEPITVEICFAMAFDLKCFFESKRYTANATRDNLEWAKTHGWFTDECETIEPEHIAAANDCLWLALATFS